MIHCANPCLERIGSKDKNAGADKAKDALSLLILIKRSVFCTEVSSSQEP